LDYFEEETMITSIKAKESVNLWNSFDNLQSSVVTWLLQSPLHNLVSFSYMLIELREGHSGQAYTIPVPYKKLGNTLTIIGSKDYQWWQALDGGTPLQVTLRGRERKAWGFVSEQRIDVKAALVLLYPQMSKAIRDKLVPKSVVVHMELR
jgi:hypothetical protein